MENYLSSKRILHLFRKKNELKPLTKQIDPNTLSESVVRPFLKLLQKSLDNKQNH